jgi:cbb3-type cytochrome c oxidase subunit III
MDGQKQPRAALGGFYLVVIALAAGGWLAIDALSSRERPRESSTEATAPADSEVSDQELLGLAQDHQTVRAGARLFSLYCARCHGSVGEGSIGPNLTDDFWIGGSAPVDIYQTIHDGRVTSGMPAAGPALGARACKQVAAYVLAVRGRNVPGRPPQGRRATAAAPLDLPTRVAER